MNGGTASEAQRWDEREARTRPGTSCPSAADVDFDCPAGAGGQAVRDPALPMEVGESRRYRVRIRYREPLVDATLHMRESGLYIVFDKPERSITPGQFAAWYGVYDESDPYDAPELFGSGVL